MAADEDGFAQAGGGLRGGKVRGADAREREGLGVWGRSWRSRPCVCSPPPRSPVDLSLDIRTAQNVLVALEPASLGQRALATLVDFLVAGAWLVLMLGFVLPTTDGGMAAQTLAWLPLLFYHLVCEATLDGRSPGKMALGLRVARLDGAAPSLGQYVIRWLFRLVDIAASSGGVAVVSIAVTRRAQRLGDLAAGTTVVRRRRRMRLAEVLYPEPGPDHTVRFPTADRLTDADVRTLRAVLVHLRTTTRRDARAEALARRAKAAVEARLGLEPVASPPEAFLRAVVADHVALVDGLGA